MTTLHSGFFSLMPILSIYPLPYTVTVRSGGFVVGAIETPRAEARSAFFVCASHRVQQPYPELGKNGIQPFAKER